MEETREFMELIQKADPEILKRVREILTANTAEKKAVAPAVESKGNC